MTWEMMLPWYKGPPWAPAWQQSLFWILLMMIVNTVLVSYEAIAWVNHWPTISFTAHRHIVLRYVIVAFFLVLALLLEKHFSHYDGP